MNIASIIVLVVAIVLLAVLMVFRSKKAKEQQQEFYKFIENVKVGDKVKTHIGVYGTIVSIRETTDGKVFTIETGGKHKSEIEVDYRVIAGPDTKETVIYDSDGNPVSTGRLLVNEQLEEVPAPKAETAVKKPAEAQKVENKKTVPKAKTPAKKPAEASKKAEEKAPAKKTNKK